MDRTLLSSSSGVDMALKRLRILWDWLMSAGLLVVFAHVVMPFMLAAGNMGWNPSRYSLTIPRVGTRSRGYLCWRPTGCATTVPARILVAAWSSSLRLVEAWGIRFGCFCLASFLLKHRVFAWGFVGVDEDCRVVKIVYFNLRLREVGPGEYGRRCWS